MIILLINVVVLLMAFGCINLIKNERDKTGDYNRGSYLTTCNVAIVLLNISSKYDYFDNSTINGIINIIIGLLQVLIVIKSIKGVREWIDNQSKSIKTLTTILYNVMFIFSFYRLGYGIGQMFG